MYSSALCIQGYVSKSCRSVCLGLKHERRPKIGTGGILANRVNLVLSSRIGRGSTQSFRAGIRSDVLKTYAMSTDPQTVEVVWALDFDGMLCDSVGESAQTAWKAATKLWPGIFSSEESISKKADIIEGMRVARPVIETGYENIPMVRAMLEGTSPESMLKGWETMLPQLMEKYGLNRAEMVELFGSTRDEWIEQDLEGWLAPNRFYPGVTGATKTAFENPRGAMYIVTTKQAGADPRPPFPETPSSPPRPPTLSASPSPIPNPRCLQARFTEALLRDMAGIPFPSDRIFSQTVSGRPKSEVLAMLMEQHPNAELRFFEDKMGTLEKIAQMEGMDPWKLFLVDWGYNTEEERERARASDRIALIGPDQYAALMAP
mmetsp:Transcript_33386/g.79152  ORF Transcript_33386/g.79152 Transcript_33386/m.79152 type:complete len:375 (-) Transcript_33386:163-1287(-)